MSPWVIAARPKTWSAGIIPVIATSALAWRRAEFSLAIFFAALFGSLFIQIATNYINDGADFLRGADTEERLGPPRMAQMGLITPKKLFWGAGLCFLLATLCGAYLIAQAGWMIFLLGLVSILCAIAYTAGPAPLAYVGLGDLFVLIFFGFAAVIGTYFCHTHSLGGWPTILLSLIIGLHGVSLIAVNNTRDIPTDLKVGKMTMSARMGRPAASYYYAATQLLPFLLLAPLAYKLHSLLLLLPMLFLPLAIQNVLKIFAADDGGDFNRLLVATAKLQVLMGLSICGLFLFSK